MKELNAGKTVLLKIVLSDRVKRPVFVPPTRRFERAGLRLIAEEQRRTNLARAGTAGQRGNQYEGVRVNLAAWMFSSLGRPSAS